MRRMLELMGAIRVRIAHCIYLGTAPPPTPRLPPGKVSPGTQYPSASPADDIYLEIVARKECSEIRDHSPGICFASSGLHFWRDMPEEPHPAWLLAECFMKPVVCYAVAVMPFAAPGSAPSLSCWRLVRGDTSARRSEKRSAPGGLGPFRRMVVAVSPPRRL